MIFKIHFLLVVLNFSFQVAYSLGNLAPLSINQSLRPNVQSKHVPILASRERAGFQKRRPKLNNMKYDRRVEPVLPSVQVDLSNYRKTLSKYPRMEKPYTKKIPLEVEIEKYIESNDATESNLSSNIADIKTSNMPPTTLEPFKSSSLTDVIGQGLVYSIISEMMAAIRSNYFDY